MADETRTGTTQPTVVHLNRDTVRPETLPPGAPEADWERGGVVPEAVAMPLRGRVIGTLLSLAWVGAFAGWSVTSPAAPALAAASPLELAAVVGAFTAPLSFLWLLVALFDRGAVGRAEAAALRRQLALLTYPAEAADVRVTTIADALRAQTRDLAGATREAAHQAESLRQILSRETRELGRVTSTIDGETTKALAGVADQVRGLSDLMDRVRGLSREMEEALDKRHQALDSVADKTGATAARLSGVLAEAGKVLGARVAQVEAVIVRQTENLEQGKAVVADFAAAAETLSSRTREAVDGLSRRTEALEQASESLTRSAVAMAGSLRTAHDEANTFGEALDRRLSSFEDHNRRIAEAAHGAAQELDAATAAALGDFNAFRDTASETLDGARSVAVAIRDMAQQADGVRRLLLTQAKSVETTARKLGEEVRGASAVLEEQGMGLTQTVERAAERIRHVSDILSRNAVDITRTTARATVEIETVSEALKQTLGDVTGISRDLRGATDGVGEAAEAATARIRVAAAGMGDVADQVAGRMRQTMSTMDGAIAQAAEAAMGRLRMVAADMGDVTDDVNTRLRDGITTMEGAVQNAGLRLRDAMAGVGDASDAAVARIRDAADGLLSSAEAISAAGGDFGLETERLTAAANVTLQHVRALGDAADGAAARTDGLRVALAEALLDFERRLDDGSARVDDATGRLRQALEAYGADAMRTLERLTGAGGGLRAQVDALAQISEDTEERIGAITGLMERRQGLLSEAGKRAADEAERAASQFGRHADALAAAAAEAAEKAQLLDSAREKIDVQRFLSQASYVIERLQAAAVDITRLFSPAVEEDLWKRFYKGEQNAFLRHAARTITRAQATSVKQLYRENKEFRQYATRYMGEYEALLKASRANDRADVLTAVFTASDMGRLYMVLAKSLGRSE